MSQTCIIESESSTILSNGKQGFADDSSIMYVYEKGKHE